MHKKVAAAVLAAAMVLSLSACSVLPVEETAVPEATVAPVATQAPEEDNSIIVQDKTEEEIRAAYIETYKLRYVVGMLMHLEPIPTNAELERMENEKKQQTPYQTAEKELVNYCRNQSDTAVKEFLEDYPTEDYTGNEANRTLKKIYDGETGREINGGTEAVTIGYETGYWRITDCEYYNMAFYANGEDENSVRLLYMCNLYHYVMEGQENLAEQSNDTELTTDNSKVDEYENAFLMVTMDDICPKDASDTLGKSQKFKPEVLLFTDYETAIKSIENPVHTFSDLYLDDDMTGSIVNGYIGQPIVTMPDLIGKYIDVSRPENVKELDDLGITNYKVEWKENDGTYVPYSILETNVAAGSLVDITDDSPESTIVVTVAEKVTPAETEAPAETAEPDSTNTETVDEG